MEKKYKFTKSSKGGVLDFYEKSESELNEQEKQTLFNTFVADFNELPNELKIKFIHEAMQGLMAKNDSLPNDDTSL